MMVYSVRHNSVKSFKDFKRWKEKTHENKFNTNKYEILAEVLPSFQKMTDIKYILFNKESNAHIYWKEILSFP